MRNGAARVEQVDLSTNAVKWLKNKKAPLGAPFAFLCRGIRGQAPAKNHSE